MSTAYIIQKLSSLMQKILLCVLCRNQLAKHKLFAVTILQKTATTMLNNYYIQINSFRFRFISVFESF